jgi:hypothetical protein
MAELRVDADVVVNMQADTWDATVSVHDPQVRRLLAGLGFAALGDRNTFPDWMGDGSLSLLAHLAGTQDRLAARDFDLTVARVHTRGNLALDFSGAAPLVSGQVVVDEFVMPLPNGASSVPLSLDFLRGWRGDLRVRLGRLVLGAGPPVQDISASLSITNGVALIQPITGQLGAGTLTAAVTCDAAEAPPAISLQARLTDMDLTTPSDRDTPDKVSGRVNADVELVASGFSPAALLATLHGRLDMVVSNGLIGGFSLSQLKRAMAAQDAEIAQSVARNALVSGVTAFGKLSIVSSIGHGEVTIKDATLTGAEGNAQASGSLQLTDGTLDVRIEMQPPVANAPKLSVHLAGPIDGPNRTPDLTALARWMVDRTR